MIDISILGCGWLGMPLGKRLVDQGYRVKGSTTTAAKLSEMKANGMIPYLIDLNQTSHSSWNDFFDSSVIIIALPPRNSQDISNDFHQKMALLVDYLENSSKGKSKVLFISSTAVYLPSENEFTEEDASVDALTRGGVSLLTIEQLFIDSEQFQTTVLRFGGLFGPNRHPGKFLSGKTNLAGANNGVNMIHLEDCIGIISQIISDSIWGETFNACSPIQKTKKEFYTSAAIALGVAPPSFNDQPAPFKKINCDKWKMRSGYQFHVLE